MKKNDHFRTVTIDYYWLSAFFYERESFTAWCTRFLASFYVLAIAMRVTILFATGKKYRARCSIWLTLQPVARCRARYSKVSLANKRITGPHLCPRSLKGYWLYFWTFEIGFTWIQRMYPCHVFDVLSSVNCICKGNSIGFWTCLVVPVPLVQYSSCPLFTDPAYGIELFS